MKPTSISIFLADGIPDGVRIIEKFNWTGRAVVASRSQLASALQRDEFSRPGVYVLLGPRDSGSRRIYIGEADVLRDRLKQHGGQKDFWTQLIAFTSSDENLNKAHVRYLEARLVKLAKKANQWQVENGNEPAMPALAERERAHAEWFLGEMLVIYPILGVDAFEDAAAEPTQEDRPEFHISERGARGKGREANEGFVVYAGATARIEETPSIHAYMKDLRKELKSRGVLVQDGEAFRLTQDYRFDSPSSAAGVLIGGSANGRITWKTADGRTLKAVQEAREKNA